MTATILIISIFVIGYSAIAFEHSIKVNKAASALITGILSWTVYFLFSRNTNESTEQLLHHLGDISAILFFLLGAMTIVELIDAHHGFDIITQKITTTHKRTLLFIITTITFFLSALLDNLTTTIVMVSLCGKLLPQKDDRLWFTGMIVIAANAGGAWSPLGDITTTMLWIGGQITAWNIVVKTILPSLAVCAIPMMIVSYRFRNSSLQASVKPESVSGKSTFILFSGIGLLLFVPVFKTLTGMPPFMGMLLALGLIWLIATKMLPDSRNDEKDMVAHALQKIDTPSILFFLGILLAVGALQSTGLLKALAGWLDIILHNDYLIGITLGLLSAIVDNVPLVAAAQGMYDLSLYPTDHHFWEFLALTTGTGGSAIIIGSAAGVAAMGIEHINFMWYLKKISLLALAGFAAGILVFILQEGL